MQRRRSAAPPPLPDKDISHYRTASPLAYPAADYVNSDLAEAVRESVHIGSSSKGTSSSSNYLSPNPAPSGYYTDLPPLIPSQRSMSPGIAPPTVSKGHSYSRSSPDMSSTYQPVMPPSAMMRAQNPFEEDELEPVGTGRVLPPGSGARGLDGVREVSGNRAKFIRATTGNTTSSSQANLLDPPSPDRGKTRTRRAMSTESYGLEGNGSEKDRAEEREIIEGQRKAAEDKKGSRHADVIDRWDPTGLGSAMWHHSGPYDAAAPSRNANLPHSKAPMQAFNGAPVQSPPRTGPITIGLPPAPPAKDAYGGTNKRMSVTQRHSTSRRMGGGGLTGQYSTSMPASGGYFPDVNQLPDEAANARKERQKQREEKRKALKAAWGTDTPEPFEDFGGSPGEGGNVDLPGDVSLSPEPLTEALPTSGKPLRSPGLRLGLGSNTPPRDEMDSPTSEVPPGAFRAPQGAGAGGVKRTKSLMQKIRTMVRQRSGSVESVPVVRPGLGPGQRSLSMNSAAFGNARPSLSPPLQNEDVVEEEELDDERAEGPYDDAPEDVFRPRVMGHRMGSGGKGVASAGRRNERPLATSLTLGQRDNPNLPMRSSSPSKQREFSPTAEHPPMPTLPSGSPTSEKPTDLSTTSAANNSRRPFFSKYNSSDRSSPQKQTSGPDPENDDLVPSASDADFVLVESPNSKARAAQALKKEQAKREKQEVLASASDDYAISSSAMRRPVNKAKNLSTPPVAPVIPDFDDILPPAREGTNEETEGVRPGLNRKTSMAKKLREKLVK